MSDVTYFDFWTQVVQEASGHRLYTTVIVATSSQSFVRCCSYTGGSTIYQHFDQNELFGIKDAVDWKESGSPNRWKLACIGYNVASSNAIVMVYDLPLSSTASFLPKRQRLFTDRYFNKIIRDSNGKICVVGNTQEIVYQPTFLRLNDDVSLSTDLMFEPVASVERVWDDVVQVHTHTNRYVVLGRKKLSANTYALTATHFDLMTGFQWFVDYDDITLPLQIYSVQIVYHAGQIIFLSTANNNVNYVQLIDSQTGNQIGLYDNAFLQIPAGSYIQFATLSRKAAYSTTVKRAYLAYQITSSNSSSTGTLVIQNNQLIMGPGFNFTQGIIFGMHFLDVRSDYNEIAATFNQLTLFYRWSSLPTAIKLPKKKNLTVYPCPAREYVVVEGIDDGSRYDIISSNGLVLVSGKLMNQIISLDRLPAGVYMLRVDTQEGYLLTTKIVRE